MAEHEFDPVSRPPPVYPQAHSFKTSSAQSSATIQNPLTPRTGTSHSGPTIRASSGPGALQSPHTSFPPGSSPRSAGYIHSFHPSMSSPGTVIPGYSEFPHSQDTFVGVPNMSSHVQMSGMQGQKRAYRQRRKDPSCDACRERKVKVSIT